MAPILTGLERFTLRARIPLLWLAVLGWVASLSLHVSALLGGTEDGVGFPVLLVGGFIVCLPASSIQGMLVETRTASQIQWFKALSAPAWMKWGFVASFVYVFAYFLLLRSGAFAAGHSCFLLPFYGIAAVLLSAARRARETARPDLAERRDLTEEAASHSWVVDDLGPSCHAFPFPLVLRGKIRVDAAEPSLVFEAIVSEVRRWGCEVRREGLRLRIRRSARGSVVPKTMLRQSLGAASCGEIAVERIEGTVRVRYEAHFVRHAATTTLGIAFLCAVMAFSGAPLIAWIMVIGMGFPWLYGVPVAMAFTSLRKLLRETVRHASGLFPTATDGGAG